MRASRRGFLTLGGAAVAGAGVGALATHAAEAGTNHPAAVSDRVPFRGARQAGIATPVPQRLAFAAYDLTVDGGVAANRAALQQMLRTWTAAAAAMTVAQTVPGDHGNPAAPPAWPGNARRRWPTRRRSPATSSTR